MAHGKRRKNSKNYKSTGGSWKDHKGTKGYLEHLEGQIWMETPYACACLFLVSSILCTTFLLSPAALAPGPRWDSLSRRHKAWLLTIWTDIATWIMTRVLNGKYFIAWIAILNAVPVVFLSFQVEIEQFTPTVRLASIEALTNIFKFVLPSTLVKCSGWKEMICCCSHQVLQ